MPRVSYKVSEEDKAIAAGNGIPLSTLYARIRSGWEIERAISTPSGKNRSSKVDRDENGEVIAQNLGKQRIFRLPDFLDEKMDQLIEKSGLSGSEYVRDVIVRHLKRKK